MKWFMIGIMVGVGVIVLASAAAALRVGWSRAALQRARAVDGLAASSSRFPRLVAAPVVVWMLVFLFSLATVMLVSGMCLLYAFALFQGEWFELLDHVPHTAGNVVVHLVYPLQIVLFALITFFLAVGGFQLVFGPVGALARFRLRIDDVGDLASRLAALLALVAGLEVVKILSYSLLVEPQRLGEFFARDTLPKADPLGLALLTAALVAAVVAWRQRARNSANPDSRPPPSRGQARGNDGRNRP
jgi:hypothetical protein